MPAELRREVVRLVGRPRQGGRPYRELAAELGMSFQTLMGWRYQTRESEPKLAPVTVAPVTESGTSLVVHGPRGLRIEGMTMSELGELWLRLS